MADTEERATKIPETLCRFEWKEGHTPVTHTCSLPEGHDGQHACLFERCISTHKVAVIEAGK